MVKPDSAPTTTVTTRRRTPAGSAADSLPGRLRRELDTLQCMTDMYCAHYHADYDGSRCKDCESLMRYAAKRLQKCPYGEDKPTCAKCPVHCYKAEQRPKVREIMRFAGPRMTWRYPIKSLVHLFDKARQVEHPMQRRRRLKAASSGTDSPSARRR